MVKILQSLEVRAGRRNHRTRFTFLEDRKEDYFVDDIRANWEDQLWSKDTCWVIGFVRFVIFMLELLLEEIMNNVKRNSVQS
jgi:hypothetical protein